MDQAVRLVRQAVLQDSKRNYGEAARCYREAITSFRELRHSRASSKRLQELLDTKLGELALILRELLGNMNHPCCSYFTVKLQLFHF